VTTTETRFLDFEGLLPMSVLLPVAAGVVVLVVLAYLRTFRAHTKPFVALLIALRLAAVALLALSLAKPIWVVQTTQVQRGTVAVIVDNSRSMTLAGSEVSRYEKMRRVLQDGLLADLRQHHNVKLYAMGGPPLAGLPPLPTLTRTGIAASIENAYLQSKPALQEGLLAGVVLLTDGIDTTGKDVLSAVGELPGSLPEIHCVGFGDPNAVTVGPADVRVAEVTANQRVIVNNTVAVRVRLTNSRISESGVMVKIMRGKSSVASPAAIDLKPGQKDVSVELKYQPTTPGEYVLSAVVVPRFGGDRLDNNVRHFPITVRPNLIRVLYVDGAIRWEHKFLRRALVDDPDIVLETYVRTGPRTKWRGTGAKTLSGNIFRPDVLRNFDVVIIGDIEADYFSPGELEALTRFVETESAGGLLLLGGYLAYGAEGLTRSHLARLLPAVFPAGNDRQAEVPFRMMLTPEGQESPIFRVFSEPLNNRNFWNSLPELDGCARVARAKKGATVLAINPKVPGIDGGAMPVAITQQFGHGRVMLFAIDTSFRWRQEMARAGMDTARYDRFWSQMIRWLAGSAPKSDRPMVEVLTDKFLYKPGERAEVIVKVYPPEPDAKDQRQIVPSVMAGCGWKLYADVPLEPDGGGARAGEPRVYRGSFVPEHEGRNYCIVEARRGGAIAESRKVDLNVQRSNLEMEMVRPNHKLLEDLAARTRGGFYTEADARQIADRIRPLQRRTALPEQKRKLWNSPVFFAGFLGCVFIEWILRRRRRMA